MTIEAVDHDIVISRDIPLMLRAKLRERLRAAHRLFLESNHFRVSSLMGMLVFMRRRLFLRRLATRGLLLVARGHLVVEFVAASELVRCEPRRRVVIHPAQPRDVWELHAGDIEVTRRRAFGCGLNRHARMNRDGRNDALRFRAATRARLSPLRRVRAREHLEHVSLTALPFVDRHLPYSTLCGCSFQSTGSCVIHIVASCMSRIALMRLIEMTD